MRKVRTIATAAFSALFLMAATVPSFANGSAVSTQSEYPTSTNKRISNNNGYDIDRPASPDLEAKDGLPEQPSSYPSSANRRGTDHNNAYNPAQVSGFKLPQEERAADCTSDYPTSGNLRESNTNGYDCSPN